MIKTIISNNCFGGVISHQYGLEFCSPTINLQILPEEFPTFCNNLHYYMDAELEMYTNFSTFHIECMYRMFDCIPNMPFGRIKDVLVCFQHYDTFDEAAELWNKRKARVDYDSIAYLFHARHPKYKQAVEQFLALDLPNSEVITEDWGMNGTHRFDVPPGMDAFGSVNGRRIIEQNFSIKDFLEGTNDTEHNNTSV